MSDDLVWPRADRYWRDRITALEAERGAAQARADALAEKLETAVLAMTDVSERAEKTYRARNGKVCTIEASDGEACEIVHSDAMFGLRATLAQINGETNVHTD